MADYLDIIINAFFAGIGSGLGNFLVLKMLLKNIEKLQKKEVKE